MRPIVKGVIATAALVAAGWWLQRDEADGHYLPNDALEASSAALNPPASGPPGSAASGHASDEDAARRAFQEHAQGRQLQVKGQVQRLLPDDRDGSRHQRFIIETDGRLSLLIAHNIDLAPRLEGLAVGERVTVLGEYQWNNQGGVMHWTHLDPQRRRSAGYIEWRGHRYQ